MLSGLRVSLYAGGLTVKYWSYAARHLVWNGNLEVPSYKEYLMSTGQPSEGVVFGRLVWFKPQQLPDQSPEKGHNSALPAAFLGYDIKMRQGCWLLYEKPGGKYAGNYSITSVKVGRTGSGLVWAEPQPDGRTTMAFKRITQNLKEIMIQNKESVAHGHPGMDTKELQDWINKNPLPVRMVEPESSCPACRGRHEKHTRRLGCLFFGITEEQSRSFLRGWSKGKTLEQKKAYLKDLREKNAKKASAERKLQKKNNPADDAVDDEAFLASAERWLLAHGARRGGENSVRGTGLISLVDSLPESRDMCGSI